MALGKTQIIIIGIVALIGIVLFLMIQGIIPGIRPPRPPQITATLKIWGLYDNQNVFTPIFEGFKGLYPQYKNITFEFRSFSNQESYNKTLLDALASGEGPDIFMIGNTSLDGYKNKLVPVLTTTFSPVQMDTLFPQVVSQNFMRDRVVYALPTSLDTLALIYNRDSFDQETIFPPDTWEAFLKVIPKLTRYDSGRRITQVGAAIGGSSNVETATDIFSLLMLQRGIPMTGSDGTAQFATAEAQNALRFYTQFSDAGNSAYTWNPTLPNDIDLFVQGKAAMIFNYASSIPKIRERAPFLNLRAAPVPQISLSGTKVALANYSGYGVSKQSKLQTLAWDFILYLTTNTDAAKGYMERTKLPPALLKVAELYKNDPDYYAFAQQAFFARSWITRDSDLIKPIFEQMLISVTGGQKNVWDALNQAQTQVNSILGTR